MIDGFHSHLEPLWLIQPNSLQKQVFIACVLSVRNLKEGEWSGGCRRFHYSARVCHECRLILRTGIQLDCHDLRSKGQQQFHGVFKLHSISQNCKAVL